MKKSPTLDNSQLAKAGLESFPEWDYLIKKGIHRRVYVKRLGNDTVKAFKCSGGFRFGLLLEEGKRLCKKYGFADSIENMNKTLSKWTEKQ